MAVPTTTTSIYVAPDGNVFQKHTDGATHTHLPSGAQIVFNGEKYYFKAPDHPENYSEMAYLGVSIGGDYEYGVGGTVYFYRRDIVVPVPASVPVFSHEYVPEHTPVPAPFLALAPIPTFTSNRGRQHEQSRDRRERSRSRDRRERSRSRDRSPRREERHFIGRIYNFEDNKQKFNTWKFMTNIIEKGEVNNYVMAKRGGDLYLKNVKTGVFTCVNFYYFSSRDIFQKIPAFRTNLLTVEQAKERDAFREAIRCFQIYDFSRNTFADFCKETCFCTKQICPYLHGGDNVRNKFLRFYALFMVHQREWFRDGLTYEDNNWLKSVLNVDHLI